MAGAFFVNGIGAYKAFGYYKATYPLFTRMGIESPSYRPPAELIEPAPPPEAGTIQPEEVLADPAARERIKQEAVAFVRRLAGQKRGPDVLVFLDRSGRPAAWLFKALWERLYPERPVPEIKFINVGREKAGDEYVGRHADPRRRERFLRSLLADGTMVGRLQKAFSVGSLAKKGEKEQVWSSYFDGQRVTLVDECRYEGTSLMMAKALLEAAFDDSVYGKRYKGTIDLEVMFKEEPPWQVLPDEDKERLFGVREEVEDVFVSPIRPLPTEAVAFRSQIKALAEEAAEDFLSEEPE